MTPFQIQDNLTKGLYSPTEGRIRREKLRCRLGRTNYAGEREAIEDAVRKLDEFLLNSETPRQP